jgi:hypothetical protein
MMTARRANSGANAVETTGTTGSGSARAFVTTTANG